MKILKKVVLEILLLIVMCLCGTAIMKLFDIILKLNYENIWTAGFKVEYNEFNKTPKII